MFSIVFIPKNKHEKKKKKFFMDRKKRQSMGFGYWMISWFDYLSIHGASNPRTPGKWDLMIDKPGQVEFVHRESSFISKARREKSLPLHYFSLFQVPVGVLRIIRQVFLCSSSDKS